MQHCANWCIAIHLKKEYCEMVIFREGFNFATFATFRYVRDFPFIAKISIQRTLISVLLAKYYVENVTTTRSIM
jgi:hypothetical protein